MCISLKGFKSMTGKSSSGIVVIGAILDLIVPIARSRGKVMLVSQAVEDLPAPAPARTPSTPPKKISMSSQISLQCQIAQAKLPPARPAPPASSKRVIDTIKPLTQHNIVLISNKTLTTPRQKSSPRTFLTSAVNDPTGSRRIV